jgi:type IV pilus assembly protein PilB
MKVRRGAARLYAKAHEATHAAAQAEQVESRQFVAPQHSGRLLGEILIENGAATPEQIEAVRARQSSRGGPLGEILIEQGVCDETTITAAIAEQHDLKVVDLRRVTPEQEALDQIGGELARAYRVLPLRLTKNGLIVALDDVPSSETLATLFTHLGRNVGILLAPASELTRSLESAYPPLDNAS